MGWYANKKVFVVGGSKGIGREVAVQLAAQGAHVVVAARGQADLDEVVAAMKAAGSADQVFGSVAFDVRDAAAVKQQADKVLELLGGLDVLLCNSGYAQPGYAHEVGADTYRDMIEVNYLGHVHAVQAFLPHFRAQRHGSICLVSSMMGFLPLYGYTAYSGSKFAIVGFAEALRQELAPVGVTVSVYYPPTTDTPGLAEENKTKPEDVWMLESESAFSATFSANDVAKHLIGHVASQRFDGLPGALNALIYVIARHLPGLTRWMSDGEVKTARRKVAEKHAAAGTASA